MICACILIWNTHCQPHWADFVRNHIIADDEFDERRNGPWGRRPEDPADWNDL